MSRGAFAYLLLCLFTFGVFMAMSVWSLALIEAEAGGQPAFDLRFSGYALAEAQAFLTALSAEGRAMYLGPQAVLDTIYPPAAAVVLAIGAWVLTPGWPGWLRLVLVAVAACGMTADLMENSAVRALLQTGADQITVDQVARANMLTLAKSLCNTVSILVILGLLALRGFAKLRGAGA